MKQTSDFLVIGSGLAGLYSAYYASQFGNVTLLTKHSLQTSSSYWAQGGIASAIDEDDSPKLHFDDTIEAGRGLCKTNAVEILVNEGPQRIKELIKDGLKFDTVNGQYSLGMEGGHSRRRVLHSAGNETGKSIVDFLISKIKNNHNINVVDNILVFKLLVKDNSCIGCKTFKWDTKKELSFFSNVTILATGGAAGVYKTSTNPHSSTGDGVVLGYNAGAVISNMEFIQFHPTAFYSPTGKTFLISEAVRGEGAYLIDHKGNRFMKDIHKLAELAPRDVVSKAIINKMKEDNVSNLFLSLRHLNAERIKERFSNIYKEALKFDIDITKDLVPVAPAAHYMIGGISTDLNGCTSLLGLYACGEVANTGVHGANRLASNSLLECLVFSKRAVDYSLSLDKKPVKSSRTNENAFTVNKEKDNTYLKLKNEISEIMNSYVGIARSRDSLSTALHKITEIDKEWTYEENEYYSERLKSLKTIATLITNGAMEREESRGTHLRLDFPDQYDRPYFIFQSKESGIEKKEMINDQF